MFVAGIDVRKVPIADIRQRPLIVNARHSADKVRQLMTHASHHLPIIDVWIGWSFDVQNTHQSLLGSRKRMIDQCVVAGNLQFEFDDGCAARRDAYRLNALKRRAFQ